MYKILFFLLVFISPLWARDTFAAGETTTVIVTEKIPGATCNCVTTVDNRDPRDFQAGMGPEVSCGDPKTRKYSCTIGKGLSGFQDVFREIVRWVVYIVMLLGVLAIAGAGIMMAYTGSSDEGGAKSAKKWIMNIIIGLIILFTFRYILGFLAPWIFS